MTAETLRVLPVVDASLNAASAVFLVAGWLLIRRGKVRAHVTCMVSAMVVGLLFLTCYLIYHFQVGATAFPGKGASRVVYFSILISHTALAACVPPLVAWTVTRAVRRRFRAHARLARWTFPIWLYVSVTGVLVYVMLYHLYPGGRR